MGIPKQNKPDQVEYNSIFLDWVIEIQKVRLIRLVGIGAALSFVLLIFVAANHILANAASSTETLWAVSQACDFEINNPEHSLDGSTQGYDKVAATCAWEAHPDDTSWIFTAFQETGLISVSEVQLTISFAVDPWTTGETIELQVSANKGVDWSTIETWDEHTPPPESLTEKHYDVSKIFSTPDDLQHAQVRLFVPGVTQSLEGFTIGIDAVSLAVVGELPSTETPTFTASVPPSETAAFQPTDTAEITPTLSFTATTVTPTLQITGTLPVSTPTLPITGTVSAITPTLTLTGTIPILTTTVVTPTLTITGTATVTTTLMAPLTPTATTTPFAPMTLNQSNATDTQILWGDQQSCGYPVQTASGSLDSAFNDQTAACGGEFAKDQLAWQVTSFQDTSFTHINDIIVEVRFSQTGWVDDQVNLELFDGTQWHTLAEFGFGMGILPDQLITLPYNVLSLLNSPETVNQVSVRLVGVKVFDKADFITIALDEVRISVAGGFEAPVLFGLAAMPAMQAVNLAADALNGSPHGDQTLTGDSCAACHRSHAAPGIILRDAWPEEAICFTCHTAAGPGTNVQPAFSNYVNTSTGFYKHDIMFSNNTHQLNETSGADFGGGNRHVECEDCHDPHNSTRGSSAAPNLPLEMAGASGVDPNWSGPGSPASFSWLANALTEYQVCFKCHSSFTTLPAYNPDGWTGSAVVANGLHKLTSGSAAQVLDSRDLAKEFNPYQTSFHPVVAQGRNQNISAATFVNGWSQTSMTYCSDCHNGIAGGGGAGSHGSPLLHLLGGSANFSTVYSNGSPRVNASEVCFQCHNFQSYVSGQNESSHFKEHDKHLNNNWGTTCYTCHDSHGSEQQHLINLDASAMTFLNGRNSQTAWYYDPVTQKAGCYVSCHGKTHNPLVYTP